MDNEVGEMRRVLNSFLQFLENDDSDSIIIAVTNNNKMLDQALYRRFDDVLHYGLPDDEQIQKLFELRLGRLYSRKIITKNVREKAFGLSHAEITKASDNCIKLVLLDNVMISAELLVMCLDERRKVYGYQEA